MKIGIWIAFLVCSIQSCSGAGLEDYLRDERTLRNLSFIGSEVLKGRPKLTEKEFETRRVMVASKEVFPMNLGTLYRSMGLPDRVYTPPGSGADPHPSLFWEYHVDNTKISGVRYLIKLNANKDGVVVTKKIFYKHFKKLK